jgi:hypothetical protein
MEMAPHQTIAEQPERIAGTCVPDRLEKVLVFAIVGKNVGSVATTIERVIN